MQFQHKPKSQKSGINKIQNPIKTLQIVRQFLGFDGLNGGKTLFHELCHHAHDATSFRVFGTRMLFLEVHVQRWDVLETLDDTGQEASVP